MKKLLFGTMLFALVIVVPISTMAAVDINVNISLPPPIVFQAPPDVIVMPDSNDVYVVPNIDIDMFFWNGWWWRLWEGRWYRSHYYNRGWRYYKNVPSFYFDVDPGWRGYYRDHNWYGHRWNYERIPYQQLQQNWKSWQNDRHWERQGTWGVQSYQPRPQKQIQELRQQRQQQYQQRPEVRQPQVQQPRQKPQERVQQPQRQEQGPQVQQPQRQPQVQQPRQKPQERASAAAKTRARHPRFSNPRDNLRFSSQDKNLRRELSSRKDKSKDLRFSNHRPSQPQGKPEEGEGEHKK